MSGTQRGVPLLTADNLKLRFKACEVIFISRDNYTKVQCRICKKISLNHTCHRQHVVHKHFNQFWSSHTTDEQGQFRCHHNDCNYATPNRSVFVIHLAYKHFELKSKLEDSGRDPGCADPDVYGNYY